MERLPELPKSIRILKPMESEMLRAVGAGNNWRTPEDCQTCGGTGYYRWYSATEIWEVVEWECNCVDQWIMFRYFLSNGIWPRYQRLGWRDAHSVDPDALKAVFEYATKSDDHAARGTGLYLHGPSGTGKTMIGTLILKMMMAKGHSGYWTTFVDLLSGKREGFEDPDARDAFVRNVRNSDFLLIDDPGKEHASGERQINWQTSIVDEVIRHRSGMQLPTIITSNHSTDEFNQRYGSAVASLLSEVQIPVPFYGRDFRKESERLEAEIMAKGLSRPVVIQ